MVLHCHPTTKNLDINEALSLFIEVKDLLSDKDKWTKEAAFRNDAGESIFLNTNTEIPAQFCITGAIGYVTGDLTNQPLNKPVIKQNDRLLSGLALTFLRKLLPEKYTSLVQFNDDKNVKHKEVIGLLDKGIRKLLFLQKKGSDSISIEMEHRILLSSWLDLGQNKEYKNK